LARIDPPKPHSVILDEPGRLEITIPVRTNWFVACFLGAWLTGWLVGEVTVPITMVTNAQKAPLPFMIFWLTAWTVGGGFAIMVFLWQILGREIIRVENNSIMTKRAIGPWGRAHEFDREHVKNLRVDPHGINFFDSASALKFWGLGGGLIAFDYGSKTFRFGRGIDEPEARRIIELMERHR